MKGSKPLRGSSRSFGLFIWPPCQLLASEADARQLCNALKSQLPALSITLPDPVTLETGSIKMLTAFQRFGFLSKVYGPEQVIKRIRRVLNEMNMPQEQRPKATPIPRQESFGISGIWCLTVSESAQPLYQALYHNLENANEEIIAEAESAWYIRN